MQNIEFVHAVLKNTKIRTLSINYLKLYRERHIKLQRIYLVGSNEKESAERGEEPPKEDMKPVHEEPEYPELTKETEEKARRKNETILNEDKAGNKTEKADKEKKSTIVQIKEPINSIEIKLGSQMLSNEKLAQSRDK